MSKKKEEKTIVAETRVNVALALKQWTKGSPELYYKLMKQMQQDIPMNILKIYLKEFIECITLLDLRFYDFVTVILNFNWYRSESLCKKYFDFVVTLGIAQPAHLTNVLIALVQRFKPDIDPLQPVLIQQRQHLTICSHVQVALKAIHDRVPMMQNTLMAIIVKQFPYFKHDVFQVECYVRNLLQLTLFMPTYHFKILELIVFKITAFDVSCPRQDILKAEKEESADCVFEIEIEMKNENYKPLLKLPEAEVLDILMNLLLTYIENTCYNNFDNSTDSSNLQLDWPSCKKLFKELLLVFENIILSTYGTCHVQFIFFFICKYNVKLCDGFLDYLWKKFHNPNSSTIYRQACASYLGCFIARSIYLPTSSMVMCLHEFCNWIHYYIDLVIISKDKKTDLLSSHGPFYYLCQAVFYVFVFRHKSIFESDKGSNLVSTWNFQRIVTCQLNPLKFCAHHLVEKFACVMRLYQLAMCDTIIERNRRELLEDDDLEVFSSDKIRSLNFFFPFDPCILPRTNKFIKPLYREYENGGLNVETTTIQATNDDEVDFLPPEPCNLMDEELSGNGHFSQQTNMNPIYKTGRKIPQPFSVKKQVIEEMMESL